MSMKKFEACRCLTALLLLCVSEAYALPTNGSDCANPTAPACFVTTVFSTGSALNSAIGGGSSGFDTDPVTIKTVNDDGTIETAQTNNPDGSTSTKISELQDDGSWAATEIVTQPAQTNPDGSTFTSQHTTNPDGSTEDTTVTDTPNADGSTTRVTNTSFGDGTTQKITVTTHADGSFDSGEIDIETHNSDSTTTKAHVSKGSYGTVLEFDTTTNPDGSDAANYPKTFTTYSRNADGSTTQGTDTALSDGGDVKNDVTVMSDGTRVEINRYTGTNEASGASYTSENDKKTYSDGSYFSQIEHDANDPVNDTGKAVSLNSAYTVQLPSCTDSDCWGNWNWNNWGGVPSQWLDGLQSSMSGIAAYVTFNYQRGDDGTILSGYSLEVDYVPGNPYIYNHTALLRLAESWNNADWSYRVEYYDDQYIIVGRRTP